MEDSPKIEGLTIEHEGGSYIRFWDDLEVTIVMAPTDTTMESSAVLGTLSQGEIAQIRNWCNETLEVMEQPLIAARNYWADRIYAEPDFNELSDSERGVIDEIIEKTGTDLA